MDGVQEEAAVFATDDLFSGRGRLRRIGGIGPAYEVLEDRGEFVRVRVIQDGEEFDYRKTDAELDPFA